MEINAVYGPSMQSTEEFWYYDGDDVGNWPIPDFKGCTPNATEWKNGL